MLILIADDDPIMVRLAKKQLEGWGHTIVTSTNGLEARKALWNPAVDLVLLDWMMPGLDGMALLKEIREDKARCHLYVIMLTSKTLPEEIAQGLEAGADDYITKPVDFAALKARIQTGQRIKEYQEVFSQAKNTEGISFGTAREINRYTARIIAGLSTAEIMCQTCGEDGLGSQSTAEVAVLLDRLQREAGHIVTIIRELASGLPPASQPKDQA